MDSVEARIRAKLRESGPGMAGWESERRANALRAVLDVCNRFEAVSESPGDVWAFCADEIRGEIDNFLQVTYLTDTD